MGYSAGDRLGSFEVLAPIGAGGMGSVYRARDPRLGRLVAIKVLQDELVANSDHLSRFEREARSASALNHPNIITIYEIGDTKGTPFIAMELVEGTRLRDLLQDAPMALRKLLNIATQMAEGLAAAHEKNIVHRDLKPENVMITSEGRVKILDFGLARLKRDVVDEVDSTSEVLAPQSLPGAVIGTTGYMSPEQASGRPVDYRSDQFALGSILYEMATGRRAFRRSTSLDTLSAIVHEDPEPIENLNPKVPPPLRWTIQRCLAKDPRDRYASTHDLAHELQTIREHLSETTSGITLGGVVPMSRRLSTLTLAAILGSTLLTALVLFRDRWAARPSDSSPPPPAASADPRAELPIPIRLAVLPFTDLDGTANGELFARGFAETVSAHLTKAGVDFIVISPIASVSLMDQNLSLEQLAQKLRANLLLQASVQSSGEDVRVNYSLLVPQGRQISADIVTGPSAKVFDLQYSVAKSVLSGLQLKAMQVAQRDSGFVNRDDEELYVRVLAHLQRYYSSSELDSAISILEGLVKRAPDSALAHAALGRAYLYKYNLTREPDWRNRAIMTSERARRIDPTMPDVHVAVAQTYLLTGRTEEAIQEFERALVQQPDSVEAILGLADGFEAAGKYREAEETYLRAIALSPELWSAHHKLGAFYFTRGDYENAKRKFAEVVQLKPDSAWGHSSLGGVQMLLGDFDNALVTFALGIQIAPHNATTYVNLGTCYYYLGRYKDAISPYRKALELSPQNALYWANLGDAYRALGQQAEERESFGRAIELAKREIAANPRDALAHGTLARSYAKTGKFDLARKHIDIALELQPKNPTRMVQAAMVANLSGKEREAAEFLERAIAAGHRRIFVEREPDFANLIRKNLLGPPPGGSPTRQTTTG